MKITLYKNFSKRKNSTKQPTGGTEVDVVLKDSCSVESPVFQLTNVDLDINYIKWGSAYYWVTDITLDHEKIYTISCTKDVLATYKTDILNTKAFVNYAAENYNTGITDSRISTKLEQTVRIFNHQVFQPIATRYGYIVVDVISSDVSNYNLGTGSYIFYPYSDPYLSTTFDRFIQKLCSDSSLHSALEKVVNGVYNAVLRCRYIPALNIDDSIVGGGRIKLGDYEIPGDLRGLHLLGQLNSDGEGHNTWKIFSDSFTFTFNDSNTFGDWRDREPYTQMYLYLPYYGNIKVPMSDYIGFENCAMIIDTKMDYNTGEIVYQRSRAVGSEKTLLDEIHTTCAIDIPLSQIQRNPMGVLQSVQSAASSLLGPIGGVLNAKKPAQKIGGIADGLGGFATSIVQGVISFNERQLSSAGSFGSSSPVVGHIETPDIILNMIVDDTVVEPLSVKDEIGIPVMKTDTLSNYSGFVQTSGISVAMAAHDADIDEVNRFCDSGIFIE